VAARVLRLQQRVRPSRACAGTADVLLLQFPGRGRRLARDRLRRRVKRAGGRVRVCAATHAQVRHALDGRLDRVLEQDDLAGRARALRAHPVTALAAREVQLARGARHVHAPDRHAGGRRVHAIHVTRGARPARVRPVARAVPEPLDVPLLACALGLGTAGWN